jgi:hypothetical protein
MESPYRTPARRPPSQPKAETFPVRREESVAWPAALYLVCFLVVVGAIVTAWQ